MVVIAIDSIALIYDIVRWEERALIKAFNDLGVHIIPIHVRTKPFVLDGYEQTKAEFSVALQRSISHYVALESTIALEGIGISVINSSDSLLKCMDKLLALSILKRAGIKTPKTAVVFSEEAAYDIAKKFGYPVVIKPINGSWGRLISLIRDDEELRSIMEHRSYLPGMLSKVHIVQEFVRKPGRDIRVFVVGNEAPVAIYRVSKHWITNTARGGKAVPARVDPELEDLSLRVAKLLKGEILGIDIFEDPVRGYLVNEVNPVPEFKNTVASTGYNLPRKIAEYIIAKIRR